MPLPQPIKAGRYDINRKPGTSSYIHYSPVAASMEVVHHYLDHFGISAYRLAFLLGVSDTHTSRWKNGKARISQPMALKCLKLLLLVDEGLALKNVKAIDWKEGIIHYYSEDPHLKG